MTKEQRHRYLGLALRIFALFFIFGVYAKMMWVWPSGWGWEAWQPEYEQMIMGMYATLGVFLVTAAKNPDAHLSLIWSPIWCSIVHGGIMFVQALYEGREQGCLRHAAEDRPWGRR